jgi:hypothetical protein
MKNLFSANVKISKKWLFTLASVVGVMGLYHTAMAQTATTSENVIVSAPTNMDGNGSVTKVNADFPGGIDKFYTYISSKITPDTSCSPGKKVLVMFMIDKDGKVMHAKVRGRVLSDKMNAQLVKVFESSPEWIAAKQDGKEIKTHFICPVSFMPKPDMMAKATTPKMN